MDSLEIKGGNKIAGEITISGSKNAALPIVTSTILSKKTVTIYNIPDVYLDTNFDFSGTKKFDNTTGYCSKSMLVIPLINHEDETIGVLQLINKKIKKS